MKTSTALLPAILLLTACGTVRPVLEQGSTKVEVKIVEKVVTLDTASVLENKYAKSEAVVSGGVLTHSLATKPVKEPVAVEFKVIQRDSIVYQDRVLTETVEVEKELTPWQTLKMKTGGLFIGLSIGFILFLIITFFINSKFFKL